jgi:hypothetical protein
MSALTTATPTLAELAAAQISTHIPAFEVGAPEREIARLRALYAAKRTEFEAFERLFIETEPDIVLRGHAGQKLVLRLPSSVGNVKLALREALEEGLLELEVQIVEACLMAQEVAQKAVTYEGDEFAPLILALCQPAVAVAEQPSNSPMASAAQVQQRATPLGAAA